LVKLLIVAKAAPTTHTLLEQCLEMLVNFT